MPALGPLMARLVSKVQPDGIRFEGGQWKCRCPNHRDMVSSLAIREADGKLALHCHAGCPTEDILGRWGLHWGDLFIAAPEANGNGHPEVAVYPYRSEAGEKVYETVRFEPKDFRPRLPDGRMGLPKDVRRVLYRLPELLAADPMAPVFLLEGEKDADNVAAEGLTATTWAGGADGWRSAYADQLRGRLVVLVPDNDAPGRKVARRVAGDLQGVAARVVVLQLPGLPEKGDISDWFAQGGNRTELARLLEEEWRGAKVGTLVAEVQPEVIEWVWFGRIARGKLTLIDGDPGLGKSLITLDVAARVSSGSCASWSDGTPCPTGGVVLMSAEDGLADTIRPRLDAAGADTTRILALDLVGVGDDRHSVTIPEDLSWIRLAVERVGAMVLVVDPLMAFLGGDVNSHRDQDVRRALRPLCDLAQELHVAVVVIRHLNKAAGGPAIYRGGGSIGISGAARTVLMVGKDPEDEERRVVAPVKGNLSVPAASLAYRLEVGSNGAVRVAWDEEPTSLTAAQLLAGPGPEESAEERGGMADAQGFLREMLEGRGPVLASEITTAAREAGVPKRALDRAKALLGVTSRKEGFQGSWAWSLGEPAKESHHPPRAQRITGGFPPAQASGRNTPCAHAPACEGDSCDSLDSLAGGPSCPGCGDPSYQQVESPSGSGVMVRVCGACGHQYVPVQEPS